MNKIHELLDNYCVIDLETTGISLKYDEIIEVGILKVRNNQIVDTYNTLVKPSVEIAQFITELTGITNEMLMMQPSISKVKKDILNFISDDVLIGHNISFDFNFLQNGFNQTLSNNCIDTLQFSRKLYPDLKHHRLSDMRSLLNLSNNLHRALSDCQTTKELYDKLKEKITIEKIDAESLFKKKHYNIDISKITPSNVNIDENNFFYEKHCVFTGTLEKLLRKDAMQLIVNLGGILDNSVTKKTNYLILGNNDYCKSIKDGKSSKQKKAEQLKLQGQDIEILDEDTFYQLLNM